MTPRQLRKWRELQQWTQTRAAQWYGVTLRHWQRFESGESPIPRDMLHWTQAYETYGWERGAL